MTTAEIIDRLKESTADLLWVSESEYPFEIVTWEHDTEMISAKLFPNLAETDESIDTIELTDFFAPVLVTEDWYEETELAQVDRYTELLHTIESTLTDVKVFRIGAVEISIYIIGKTPDGALVGLKTQVVET